MKISCLLRKIEFTSRYLLKSGPSIEDFNFCIFREHLHHNFISQSNFFWELKSNPRPLLVQCEGEGGIWATAYVRILCQLGDLHHPAQPAVGHNAAGSHLGDVA